MPPCGCRLRSLICVYWIVLFAVRKDCVRVNFVVWGTEGTSVPCVCLIRFITQRIPLHEYLHYFVATRNTRASSALGELALVIHRCRTDLFSLSFLPATVRRWNLLWRVCLVTAPLALLRAVWTCANIRLSLIFFVSLFKSLALFYSLPDIMIQLPFWFLRDVPFPSSIKDHKVKISVFHFMSIQVINVFLNAYQNL